MLIIVDANVANEFTEKTAEAKAITRWLIGKGKLSTGGKNLAELNLTVFRPFMVELIRSGRAVKCLPSDIDQQEKALPQELIKSNDEHVLALALVGGCRLLYTNDEPLMSDFKNKDIINHGRGKCFRDAAKHARLLR